MYEHHDAILHSVSEGLIVLDRNGVALVNDEARRLLALPPGPVARSDLPEFLRTWHPELATRCGVTDDRYGCQSVAVDNRHKTRGRHDPRPHRLQGALGELSRCRC